MRTISRYPDGSWWVTVYDSEGRMVLFRQAEPAEVPTADSPEFAAG